MQYLTLSIRCILPQHPQKNCLLKIHNRQLDLHIQLENIFIHNYQYVYRLWPCQPGNAHVVRLELWEKREEQNTKLRGTAEAKILCTHQGQLYRFHGNRSEGQEFLMRFWVEKTQLEGEQSQEEAELRKMNSEMEQSLLKYRKEIQNYQEFLYFTNNVIKELNSDSIEIQEKRLNEKENLHEQKQPIYIYETNEEVQQNEFPPIPTKRKAEQPLIVEEETYRSKAISKHAQLQQNSSNKSQVKSQIGSLKSGSRAKTKAGDYLSKYRYLEEIDESRIEDSRLNIDSISQVSRKTPINLLKEQLYEENSEIQGKRQRQMEISNKIKQRRQQYFIIEQLKQVEESRREKRRNLETPINRLSSNLISKISKHSLYRQQQASQEAYQNRQKGQQRVNMQTTGAERVSTRSQTGLKGGQLKYEKKPSIHDYVLEAKQQIQIQHQQKQSSNRSEIKSLQHLNPSYIIKTIAAPIGSTNTQEPIILEDPVIQHQSIIKNIARRRKVIAQNSASIIGQMEEMNHSIHSVSKQEDLTGSAVSKLVIFSLCSTFYANFKSSTKKCIIEHNSQVYQTELQKNNLKQTSWSDRIVISRLRPAEDLVFMVYSIRMDHVELEGTAIASINQIISSSQKNFKLYLYFDNIAVGSIEFDVDREKKVYKRLTVSLPQIKAKSPPRQEVGPKTIRIKTLSEQYSRIEAHPFRRQPSDTAEFKHSDRQHSSLMPNNNEMTKKVRNIKLTKLSRLSKVK